MLGCRMRSYRVFLRHSRVEGCAAGYGKLLDMLATVRGALSLARRAAVCQALSVSATPE